MGNHHHQLVVSPSSPTLELPEDLTKDFSDSQLQQAFHVATWQLEPGWGLVHLRFRWYTGNLTMFVLKMNIFSDDLAGPDSWTSPWIIRMQTEKETTYHHFVRPAIRRYHWQDGCWIPRKFDDLVAVMGISPQKSRNRQDLQGLQRKHKQFGIVHDSQRQKLTIVKQPEPCWYTMANWTSRILGKLTHSTHSRLTSLHSL